jgi:hypothetical protein
MKVKHSRKVKTMEETTCTICGAVANESSLCEEGWHKVTTVCLINLSNKIKEQEHTIGELEGRVDGLSRAVEGLENIAGNHR